jgi:hypothetical protein
MKRPADIIAVQACDSVCLIVAKYTLCCTLDFLVAGFFFRNKALLLKDFELTIYLPIYEIPKQLRGILLVERSIFIMQFADTWP